jgi:hypothetical protein
MGAFRLLAAKQLGERDIQGGHDFPKHPDGGHAFAVLDLSEHATTHA